MTGAVVVERETALVKVHAPESRRGAVRVVVERLGARIIDSCPDTVIVEMTDTPTRLAALIESVQPFGVREMLRTGRLAMTLGASAARRCETSAVDADRTDAPQSWCTQADGIA